jgi:protein-L-isoaspartate(D-aspartate) O-methyltransferase
LLRARLEPAIGVICRPETERASHSVPAALPHHFDECLWIDRTEAVQPASVEQLEGMPDPYPFGP